MATAYGTRFPWMTLWNHRSLLRQFTVRYIHARHRGSILGFTWAFLNPLLMLALYTFIFSKVFEGEFRGGEHQPRYALVIFLGLMFYHLVADILATAPGLIVSNPNFVKKVVFPLEILPASAVGASLFHFGVSMILFLFGALLFQHPFTWVALWLPIIALPILILVLGLGWFLSALGVFLRDLQQVMGMINLILIYTSCIFFPPEKVASVAPAVWSVLRFNPLLQSIDLARNAVLWGQPPSWSILGFTYAAALGVAVLGYWTFRTLRPAFADVV
jgi:lipopolysaccharide transport system permease protein